MRKELFEFRHIVKHIGGHAALRDVSLRLYQDEITFLVGRGSGRSVLSQMMMGELTPDSGTMLLLEKPYQPLSPSRCRALLEVSAFETRGRYLSPKADTEDCPKSAVGPAPTWP